MYMKVSHWYASGFMPKGGHKRPRGAHKGSRGAHKCPRGAQLAKSSQRNPNKDAVTLLNAMQNWRLKAMLHAMLKAMLKAIMKE